MSKYLKFASHITGTEYDRLQKSTPYSRQKVKALSLAVFIPSVMWCLSGFLLSYAVLQASLAASFAIAAMLGALVFTLERLIVMGNGHWLMSTFRLFLGAVIAYLGAQLIDLVVFKTDIENKLPTVKHVLAMESVKDYHLKFDEQHGLASLKNEIAEMQVLWEHQQEAAIIEAGGLSGNGLKGAGSATRFKQEIADKTLARINILKAKLEAKEMLRAEGENPAYEAAYANISDNSILLRIKAMELLLKNESDMRHIYWGFTAFMFLLEFLVIIFKGTMKKSAYEKELAAIERISDQRIERLYGPQSPMLQPHHYHPVAAPLSKKLSTNLNSLL